MMTIYKVTEVFVPGGLPRHTYVARTARKLEEALASTRQHLCKIATVTGATKSGKTVLVKKVFSGIPTVWIEGGHVKSAKDFWDIVGSQLNIPAEAENLVADESGTQIGGELSTQGNIIVARAGSKLTAVGTQKSTVSRKRKFVTFTPWQAAQEIGRVNRPVVIDDFHYIPRVLQGDITRALKPLVFDGVPVIYLAIPHRRYDAVKVEREMNGRIEPVEVPTWNPTELAQIAQLGFPLLNVTPDVNTSDHLAREAQGSPHLMQEFCRSICHMSGLQQTSATPYHIDPSFNYEIVFRKVAKELGKSMYEKLARGPRTRTDRKPRLLRNGSKADIYAVVLHALAYLKPGVVTIEHEEIRSALRSVLQDDLPQAHEVARVLEQMAKVSATDESSVPVIDYEKDERKLHITDPFFAFFLRWGGEVINPKS